MKLMLVALTCLLTASLANAKFNYQTVDARTMICAELNAELDQAKILRVVFNGLFGVNNRVTVDRSKDCHICYDSNPWNVKAADGWCTLGRICKLMKRYTRDDDDDSGSSNDDDDDGNSSMARKCRKEYRSGRYR